MPDKVVTSEVIPKPHEHSLSSKSLDDPLEYPIRPDTMYTIVKTIGGLMYKGMDLLYDSTSPEKKDPQKELLTTVTKIKEHLVVESKPMTNHGIRKVKLPPDEKVLAKSAPTLTTGFTSEDSTQKKLKNLKPLDQIKEISRALDHKTSFDEDSSDEDSDNSDDDRFSSIRKAIAKVYAGFKDFSNYIIDQDGNGMFTFRDYPVKRTVLLKTHNGHLERLNQESLKSTSFRFDDMNVKSKKNVEREFFLYSMFEKYLPRHALLDLPVKGYKLLARDIRMFSMGDILGYARCQDVDNLNAFLLSEYAYEEDGESYFLCHHGRQCNKCPGNYLAISLIGAKMLNAYKKATDTFRKLPISATLVPDDVDTNGKLFDYEDWQTTTPTEFNTFGPNSKNTILLRDAMLRAFSFLAFEISAYDFEIEDSLVHIDFEKPKSFEEFCQFWQADEGPKPLNDFRPLQQQFKELSEDNHEQLLIYMFWQSKYTCLRPVVPPEILDEETVRHFPPGLGDIDVKDLPTSNGYEWTCANYIYRKAEPVKEMKADTAFLYYGHLSTDNSMKNPKGMYEDWDTLDAIENFLLKYSTVSFAVPKHLRTNKSKVLKYAMSLPQLLVNFSKFNDKLDANITLSEYLNVALIIRQSFDEVKRTTGTELLEPYPFDKIHYNPHSTAGYPFGHAAPKRKMYLQERQEALDRLKHELHVGFCTASAKMNLTKVKKGVTKDRSILGPNLFAIDVQHKLFIALNKAMGILDDHQYKTGLGSTGLGFDLHVMKYIKHGSENTNTWAFDMPSFDSRVPNIYCYASYLMYALATKFSSNTERLNIFLSTAMSTTYTLVVNRPLDYEDPPALMVKYSGVCSGSTATSTNNTTVNLAVTHQSMWEGTLNTAEASKEMREKAFGVIYGYEPRGKHPELRLATVGDDGMLTVPKEYDFKQIMTRGAYAQGGYDMTDKIWFGPQEWCSQFPKLVTDYYGNEHYVLVPDPDRIIISSAISQKGQADKLNHTVDRLVGLLNTSLALKFADGYERFIPDAIYSRIQDLRATLTATDFSNILTDNGFDDELPPIEILFRKLYGLTLPLPEFDSRVSSRDFTYESGPVLYSNEAGVVLSLCAYCGLPATYFCPTSGKYYCATADGGCGYQHAKEFPRHQHVHRKMIVKCERCDCSNMLKLFTFQQRYRRYLCEEHKTDICLPIFGVDNACSISLTNNLSCPLSPSFFGRHRLNHVAAYCYGFQQLVTAGHDMPVVVSNCIQLLDVKKKEHAISPIGPAVTENGINWYEVNTKIQIKNTGTYAIDDELVLIKNIGKKTYINKALLQPAMIKNVTTFDYTNALSELHKSMSRGGFFTRYLRNDRRAKHVVTKFGTFTHDMEYIVGPPGCGKTTQLSALVEHYFNLGLDVLCLADAHATCDNIANTLSELGLRVYRHVNQQSTNTYTPKTNPKVSLYQPSFGHYITVATSKSTLGRRFDAILVDEAGVTNLLTELLLVANFTKESSAIYFFGDPLQRPPVMAEEVPLHFASFFNNRTIRSDKSFHDEAIILTTNYRSSKFITELFSNLFYGGIVKSYKTDFGSVKLIEHDAVQLHGTEITGYELSLLQTLVNINDYHLLAPTNNQANYLQQHTETVTSTIDSYQGREHDNIAILWGNDRWRDASRDNVALSRAKTNLIIIGTHKQLKHYREHGNWQTCTEGNVIIHTRVSYEHYAVEDGPLHKRGSVFTDEVHNFANVPLTSVVAFDVETACYFDQNVKKNQHCLIQMGACTYNRQFKTNVYPYVDKPTHLFPSQVKDNRGFNTWKTMRKNKEYLPDYASASQQLLSWIAKHTNSPLHFLVYNGTFDLGALADLVVTGDWLCCYGQACNIRASFVDVTGDPKCHRHLVGEPRKLYNPKHIDTGIRRPGSLGANHEKVCSKFHGDPHDPTTDAIMTFCLFSHELEETSPRMFNIATTRFPNTQTVRNLFTQLSLDIPGAYHLGGGYHLGPKRNLDMCFNKNYNHYDLSHKQGESENFYIFVDADDHFDNNSLPEDSYVIIRRRKGFNTSKYSNFTINQGSRHQYEYVPKEYETAVFPRVTNCSEDSKAVCYGSSGLQFTPCRDNQYCTKHADIINAIVKQNEMLGLEILVFPKGYIQSLNSPIKRYNPESQRRQVTFAQFSPEAYRTPATYFSKADFPDLIGYEQNGTPTDTRGKLKNMLYFLSNVPPNQRHLIVGGHNPRSRQPTWCSFFKKSNPQLTFNCAEKSELQNCPSHTQVGPLPLKRSATRYHTVLSDLYVENADLGTYFIPTITGMLPGGNFCFKLCRSMFLNSQDFLASLDVIFEDCFVHFHPTAHVTSEALVICTNKLKSPKTHHNNICPIANQYFIKYNHHPQQRVNYSGRDKIAGILA